MKKLFLALLSILFLASCGSVEDSPKKETKAPVTENKVEPVEEPKITIEIEPISEKDEEVDEASLEPLKNPNEVGMESFIESLMLATDSYIPAWNKENFKDRWNYIDGVFLKSILSLYETTNQKKYLDFVIQYVDYYISPNGFFRRPNETDGSAFVSSELDSVCESNILFYLYKYTKDEKYEKAILNTYMYYTTHVPRLPDGICYSHKATYLNQVWLDGFYMYAPFALKFALSLDDETKKEALLTDLYNQYKFVREHLFDENKKLYYHGYSETDIFWAKKNKCSETFWLRSNGWFLASLADVLEYYPNGEKREYLKSIFTEAINGILQYQDQSTKMFYQVIDKAGESANVSYSKYLQPLNKKYNKDAVIENYLESSGSALVAYSILKGYNSGIFSRDLYNKAIDIYNGITSNYFENNQLKNICITAGLGPESRPYRDGSFEYYLAEEVGENDAKGVGPLIMCYVEAKKQEVIS